MFMANLSVAQNTQDSPQEKMACSSTADVQALANDREKLEVVRSRLSDLSWFMKTLAEPIARRAETINEERVNRLESLMRPHR